MPAFIDVGRSTWVRMDEIVAISAGQPAPGGQFALAQNGAEPIKAVVLLRNGQLVPAYRDAGSIAEQLDGGRDTAAFAPASSDDGQAAASPEVPAQASPEQAPTEQPAAESSQQPEPAPAPPRRKINPIQLQKYLKGISYPTDKETLQETARRNGAPEDVIAALQQVPEQSYNAPKDVSQQIGKLT
ncbi:MAG: DUF2795 domain-containing protein [Actinomycetota bacterium]|nr:DUF2795 domain-containing protein [Actinomycetota bacterium]